MAGTKSEFDGPSMAEFLTVPPRQRWTTAEKPRMIKEIMEPESAVSLVTRRYGVTPNLMCRWKKQMTDGGEMAAAADDQVVSLAKDWAWYAVLLPCEALNAVGRQSIL